MGQLRVERVQELVKQEIGKMILTDLKDPRVKPTAVTVTRVKMTPDLRSAKVFVSVMGGKRKTEACLAGLHSALGYLRREIGKRVKLRYTPELAIEIDTTLDYSMHIERLLHEAKVSEVKAT